MKRSRWDDVCRDKTPELLSECQKSPSPVSAAASTSDPAAAGPDRPSSPASDSCSICLGHIENMSHTDSCGHKFCFTCLLEWSKVNPVCPLCKKTFKSIIHTIHSDKDYKSYTLPERPPPERIFPPGTDFEILYQSNVGGANAAGGGGGGRGNIMEFSLLDLLAPFAGGPFNFHLPPVDYHSRRSRRLATSDFRRSIYENNRYVRPETVIDITGRSRECSPAWYRENPAQTHRLVPWLNRELTALGNYGPLAVQRIPYVLQQVLEYVSRYPIMSPDFRLVMEPYLGSRTAHFQHEFYNFARSVYDMVGYDREVQYQDGPPQVHGEPRDRGQVETLVLSSDNEEEPPAVNLIDPEQPGPSRLTVPGTSKSPEPICINTSSDEEEDIEVLTHVKHKNDETPVIIDIPTSSGEEEDIKEHHLDKVIEGLSAFDSFSRRIKRGQPSTSRDVDSEDENLYHRFKGKGKGKKSSRAEVETEEKEERKRSNSDRDTGSEKREKRKKKKKKRKRERGSASDNTDDEERESERKRRKRKKIKKEKEDEQEVDEGDLRAKVERLKSLSRPTFDQDDENKESVLAAPPLKQTIRRSVRFV